MSYVSSSIGYKSRSRRSRVRRRGAFTIALLGLAAIWLVAHATPASIPASGIGPVTIAAELPNAAASSPPMWSDADQKRLGRDLHGAFAPAIAGATGWSFAVVAADGRTLFDDRGERAVAPASVQKLLVAASALDALGATYRFHTIFAARDGPSKDGQIDGNLWLVGSGDPSLVTADLRNGIAMLARSGLRRINGAIVVDATALKGPELNSHWDRDDNGQDYAAPVSSISLDGNTIESEQRIGGVEEKVWTPMQNVAAYVAAQTKTLLAARGISSTGPSGVGPSPLTSVDLWDHRSAPLIALEMHMLFVSDNHYADQLLRTVGAEVSGIADDAGGIQAERRFLQRLGIATPGLRLFDGSGLSPDNRVAATTVTHLLYDREPALYPLLPLGGRQGTLEDYGFTTARGRVRAKSGHLSNVSSLAGYANTLHHGRVAFAFIIDGSAGDPDAGIVRAVDRLTAF